MVLNRISTNEGVRWTLDGGMLPNDTTLSQLLGMSKADMTHLLRQFNPEGHKTNLGLNMSPVEPEQEVWAAGVTYLRSRIEREAESAAADVYALVYEADRPELFFKALGWRTVGHSDSIRVRKDSNWNVPEPELTLVINRYMEIVGYTAGNDVSSRSIEGANPLYLPQAKSYDGSCSVGPGIVLCDGGSMVELGIHISIMREGSIEFEGQANTSQMKRSLEDLVQFLGREMTFPNGVFLMTGTGIVPGAEFSLMPKDIVTIRVGEVELVNPVAEA